MTTVTSTRLRPMSDAERTAVDMHDEACQMEEICSTTGLTRPQVAAAVELRDKFEAIITPDDVAPAPVPVKAALVVTKPAVAPKAAVQPTPVAPKDDVETLLATAEKSPQPRAQALAADVRNGITTLRTLIVNDEKFRTLTALVEVHRKHLAATEAELAALVGTEPSPARDDRPEIVIDVEPFRETEPAPAPTELTAADRAKLAYSPEVRAWAQGTGWEVGANGRMSGGVVAAFLAAHPGWTMP